MFKDQQKVIVFYLTVQLELQGGASRRCQSFLNEVRLLATCIYKKCFGLGPIQVLPLPLRVHVCRIVYTFCSSVFYAKELVSSQLDAFPVYLDVLSVLPSAIISILQPWYFHNFSFLSLFFYILLQGSTHMWKPERMTHSSKHALGMISPQTTILSRILYVAMNYNRKRTTSGLMFPP